MWNAYKEEKKKYGVRYLSTAKRLSKEEIASMSKKEIKAEMDAADRKRAMCKESSPDNKMLLSNSVDLVLENCDRRIYGVCGFFIDIKGRDYERYGIRFQDVPEFDDCVSLESLFDECVQIVADSGLSIYVDSNGNVGTNHKYYCESHDKLAKAQRKLSRMKGSKKHEDKSNNYIKQLRKVNKIHRHIANQRLDNLHKISTEIANQYDVVCVESLNMRAMANRGFGNGKSTLDNGYGMLLDMLEYKLSARNKYLVKVDKWFPSSQICSCCGTLHPEMKDLSKRKMICGCGLAISRDQNAAINILNEGLRLLSEAA